jgi:23S rRNA pseudouridine1911/1915/1917 synthase
VSKEQKGKWKKISLADSGERLDIALAKYFNISRSRVQNLIEQKYVLLDTSTVKANRKVDQELVLDIFLPDPKPLDLVPQDIPLEILYQDEHLAVIEKPAGLVVHPSVGHEDGTLVNALLHHLGDLSKGHGIAGTFRPGIVHRIDKETSGILVITKSDLAHESLSEQFKNHSISRKYLGLCWGILPAEGSVEKPIGRDPKERKRMAVVEGGRSAKTHFRSQESFHKSLNLFEAELFTGRTHQIRVHFSTLGFPLVGDVLYTSATRSAKKSREENAKILQKKCSPAFEKIQELESRNRQFLHAALLEFTHPKTLVRMKFTSALPLELQNILEDLK